MAKSESVKNVLENHLLSLWETSTTPPLLHKHIQILLDTLYDEIAQNFKKQNLYISELLIEKHIEEQYIKLTHRLPSFANYLKDRRLIIDLSKSLDTQLIIDYKNYLQHHINSLKNVSSQTEKIPEIKKAIMARKFWNEALYELDQKNTEETRQINSRTMIKKRLTSLGITENYEAIIDKCIYYLQNESVIIVTFDASFLKDKFDYHELRNVHQTKTKGSTYINTRNRAELIVYNFLSPKLKKYFEENLEARPRHVAVRLVDNIQGLGKIKNYGGSYAVLDPRVKPNLIYSSYKVLDYTVENQKAPPLCTFHHFDLFLAKCPLEMLRGIVNRVTKGKLGYVLKNGEWIHYNQQYDGFPGYIEGHIGGIDMSDPTIVRHYHFDPSEYVINENDLQILTALKITVTNSPQEPYANLANSFFDHIELEETSTINNLLSSHTSLKHITNDKGDTPLMQAVKKRDLSTIKTLIKHQANIYTENSAKESPYSHAIKNKALEILKCFITNDLLRHAIDFPEVQAALWNQTLNLHHLEKVNDEMLELMENYPDTRETVIEVLGNLDKKDKEMVMNFAEIMLRKPKSSVPAKPSAPAESSNYPDLQCVHHEFPALPSAPPLDPSLSSSSSNMLQAFKNKNIRQAVKENFFRWEFIEKIDNPFGIQVLSYSEIQLAIKTGKIKAESLNTITEESLKLLQSEKIRFWIRDGVIAIYALNQFHTDPLNLMDIPLVDYLLKHEQTNIIFLHHVQINNPQLINLMKKQGILDSIKNGVLAFARLLELDKNTIHAALNYNDVLKIICSGKFTTTQLNAFNYQNPLIRSLLAHQDDVEILINFDNESIQALDELNCYTATLFQQDINTKKLIKKFPKNVHILNAFTENYFKKCFELCILYVEKYEKENPANKDKNSADPKRSILKNGIYPIAEKNLTLLSEKKSILENRSDDIKNLLSAVAKLKALQKSTPTIKRFIIYLEHNIKRLLIWEPAELNLRNLLRAYIKFEIATALIPLDHYFVKTQAYINSLWYWSRNKVSQEEKQLKNILNFEGNMEYFLFSTTQDALKISDEQFEKIFLDAANLLGLSPAGTIHSSNIADKPSEVKEIRDALETSRNWFSKIFQSGRNGNVTFFKTIRQQQKLWSELDLDQDIFRQPQSSSY